MGGREFIPAEESAGAGGVIIEVASQRVTRLGGVPREVAAADRLSVEHRRSEQPWLPCR